LFAESWECGKQARRLGLRS